MKEKKKNPRDLAPWTKLFSTWLKSMEGGGNGHENAMEYGRKIRWMASYGLITINDLYNRTNLNRMATEMPKDRAMKPITI